MLIKILIEKNKQPNYKMKTIINMIKILILKNCYYKILKLIMNKIKIKKNKIHNNKIQKNLKI